MKVSELSGEALDRWVARAMGYAHLSAREAAFALDGQISPCVFTTSRGNLRLASADSVTAWNPSSDWACGGPIIDRERISIIERGDHWFADTRGASEVGGSPLEAA